MTDYFTRAGPPKNIKNPGQFASIAFDLVEKEVSDIQDFGDGFYLLEVVEKIPAQIPELNAVEEKVMNDLIKKKQDEMAKQDAEKFLTDVKNGESMEEAGKKYELKPQNTGFFKRTDSIPNIGYEREIAQIAFSLTEQDSLAQEVLDGRKGYYVVKFSGKELPSPEGFDKEKEDIKTRLLQQKKATIFREWLTQLKDKSEISIQEGFLES
jgi:peptidyl-prolyl cis-trans isomerase D